MARAGCGPVKGSVGPTVNWAAGGNLAALFLLPDFLGLIQTSFASMTTFRRLLTAPVMRWAPCSKPAHSEGEHCDGAAVNRKPRQGGVSVESSIDIIHPCPYAAVPILQGDDQRRHLTEDRGTEILLHCAT